jgi:hypothetical protein
MENTPIEDVKKKLKFIIGPAGSGKSTYIMNYLIKNGFVKKGWDGKYEFNDFVILSYTHIGKSEILKKIFESLGYSYFNTRTNYSYARTIFSFLFRLLKDIKKEAKLRNSTITRFSEGFSEFYNKFKELTDTKSFSFFEFAWKNLQEDFKLNPAHKELIRNIVEDLQKEEDEKDIDTKKMKEYFAKLSRSELLFVLLVTENLIYDDGVLYNVFENKKIDKTVYVIEKWRSLFGISFSPDEIKDAIRIISEKEIPVSTSSLIYLVKNFYEDYIQEPIYYKKLIIIDEAQDTPDLFISLIQKCFNYEELILSGDPYQAIFIDLAYSSEFTSSIYSIKNVKFMDTMYRYPKQYTEFIQRNIPNLRIYDFIQKYEAKKDVIYERIYLSYRDIGLLINHLKNNTDVLLVANNLKKLSFSKPENVLFLPYKDHLLTKKKTISRYMIALYLTQRTDLFSKLMKYYDFYPSISDLKIQEIEKKYKESNMNQKKFLEENREFILSYLKKYTEKDFVIASTTHKLKGKTVKEKMYYIPNMGMYYYFPEEYRFFIHNMLKYVALTRISEGNKISIIKLQK